MHSHRELSIYHSEHQHPRCHQPQQQQVPCEPLDKSVSVFASYLLLFVDILYALRPASGSSWADSGSFTERRRPPCLCRGCGRLLCGLAAGCGSARSAIKTRVRVCSGCYVRARAFPVREGRARGGHAGTGAAAARVYLEAQPIYLLATATTYAYEVREHNAPRRCSERRTPPHTFSSNPAHCTSRPLPRLSRPHRCVTCKTKHSRVTCTHGRTF